MAATRLAGPSFRTTIFRIVAGFRTIIHLFEKTISILMGSNRFIDLNDLIFLYLFCRPPHRIDSIVLTEGGCADIGMSNAADAS